MILNIFLVTLLVASLFDASTAACPNWCNQRGICTDPHINGGHCVCENGFTGDDCSQRYCPMAYDPSQLQTRTNRRTVRLETGHLGGEMMGRLGFTFSGATVFLDADASQLTTNLCTQMLTAMQSITKVTCVRETFHPEQHYGSYLIVLEEYPSYPPYMNNIRSHQGNPGRDLFSCDVTQVNGEAAVGAFCRITDVVTDNIPDFVECANHGVCNRYQGGKCQCEPGYRGIACDDVRDTQDINTTYHLGPFFTGTLVRWHIEKKPNADFYLWNAQINRENVTSIRGDKWMRHHGMLSVENAPLNVLQLSTEKKEQDMEHFLAQLPHANMRLVGDIREMDTTGKRRHISATTLDTVGNLQEVFSVSHRGDVSTTGTITADQGRFTVDEGQVILEGGMTVSQDMSLGGRLLVEDGLMVGTGVSVTPAGVSIDHQPASVHSDLENEQPIDNSILLDIKARSPTFNGTFVDLHAAGQDAVFLRTRVRGQTTFQLSSGGDVEMSRLKLLSGGIQVKAGGVEVLAGGMTVTGDLSVKQGRLQLMGETLQAGSLQGLLTEREPGNKASSSNSKDNNVGEAALMGSVQRAHYTGSVLSLQASNATQGHYRFIDVRKGDKSVLSLSSQGKLRVSEVIVTSESASVDGEAASLTVLGATQLYGGVSLRPLTLTPVLQSTTSSTGNKKKEWVVHIPAHATFVTVVTPPVPLQQGDADTIVSDHMEAVFEASLTPGRILVVTNDASIPISTTRFQSSSTTHVKEDNHHHKTKNGFWQVPAKTTLFFVSDGTRFQDISALHAPVTHLSQIESLTAKENIHIGNVTFTAYQLAASSLSKNRLLVTGNDGKITDYEKLQFHKGVLSTPALKSDRLAGHLDAKGYEIRNVLLPKPRFAGGAWEQIESLSFAMSSENAMKEGILYVTRTGQVKAATGMEVTDDGRLQALSTWENDIQGAGHTLKDVSIASVAALTGVQQADIMQLKLPQLLTMKTGQKGKAVYAVCIQQETGLLVSCDRNNGIYTGDFVYMHPDTKEVMVSDNKQAIWKIHRLQGVNADNAVDISNVKFVAANAGANPVVFDTAVSLPKAKDVTITDTLRLTKASNSKSTTGAEAKGVSVLTVDATGLVQSDAAGRVPVYIPQLVVDTISVAETTPKVWDLKQVTLRNATLDIASLRLIHSDSKQQNLWQLPVGISTPSVSLPNGQAHLSVGNVLTVTDLGDTSSITTQSDLLVKKGALYLTSSAYSETAIKEDEEGSEDTVVLVMDKKTGKVMPKPKPSQSKNNLQDDKNKKPLSAEELQRQADMYQYDVTQRRWSFQQAHIHTLSTVQAQNVQLSALAAKSITPQDGYEVPVSVSATGTLSRAESMQCARVSVTESLQLPSQVYFPSQKSSNSQPNEMKLLVVNPDTGAVSSYDPHSNNNNNNNKKLSLTVNHVSTETLQVTGGNTVSLPSLSVTQNLKLPKAVSSQAMFAPGGEILLLGADAVSGDVRALSGVHIVPPDNLDSNPNSNLNNIVLNAAEQSLYISHIKAPKAFNNNNKANTLTLHQPLILSPVLKRATLEDTVNIVTETLTVKDTVDFQADVLIGGSVSVRGSVIGRGPYVDSSDSRLKTKIVSLQEKYSSSNQETQKKSTTTTIISSSGLLDKVMQLQAVEYEWKQDPTRREIGYLAQNVSQLFPEVVYNLPPSLSDGQDTSSTAEDTVYQGVAYSRLSVLALEAVKDVVRTQETQQQATETTLETMQATITRLEGDVLSLQQQVQSLTQQLQQVLSLLQEGTHPK